MNFTLEEIDKTFTKYKVNELADGVVVAKKEDYLNALKQEIKQKYNEELKNNSHFYGYFLQVSILHYVSI